MNTKYSAFLIFLCVFLVGCGKNIQFGGKVTFEDGKPLPTGKVIFSTDSFQADGRIGPDGSYRLGSLKKDDGLPPGNYKVYIRGASDITDDGETPLIDGKFADYKTTPLSCEIKRGGPKTFDFKVASPTQ